MKFLPLALLLPNAAFAVCVTDVRNTTPTEEGLGLPGSDVCPNCREINRFPNDSANDAWNYVQHGYAKEDFDRYESLWGLGPEEQFTVRTKNQLGQSVTTTIIVKFDTWGASIVNISLHKRVRINGYQMLTVLSSGRVRNVTLPPGAAEVIFDVPADTGEDGFTPGEDCLTNSGGERSTGGHTGGGGGGGEPNPGPPNCSYCPGPRK